VWFGYGTWLLQQLRAPPSDPRVRCRETPRRHPGGFLLLKKIALKCQTAENYKYTEGTCMDKTTKQLFETWKSIVSGPAPVREERDAEGQMAKGELMNLASKAQELADMMKDDTQLEAWVQSKITKAKDYISSVHDYMNGNPDKID
jgi:hypothetical protein